MALTYIVPVRYCMNRGSANGAPAGGAFLVDIPEDWEPRAKQQPTGLIAYGAARRRPAGLWLPASASCLGRRSRLAGHGPNNDSLFLPQAAVVVVVLWACSVEFDFYFSHLSQP